MFVTKIINPESEVKKKQMAKELEAVLQEQIATKIKRKEEERRIKILEEQHEEERWRREIEEQDKQDIKNEKSQVVTREEPINGFKHLEELPRNKYEIQLIQLRNEIVEKEKEFNKELEKLKLAASTTNSTRQIIENQLSQLKNNILRKHTTNVPKPSERYYIPKNENRTGIGSYSKYYFTKHPILRDYSRNENPKEDNYLPGESLMVPWTESKEPLNTEAKGKTMRSLGESQSIGESFNGIKNKRTCERLDDLMKEFLINKNY